MQMGPPGYFSDKSVQYPVVVGQPCLRTAWTGQPKYSPVLPVQAESSGLVSYQLFSSVMIVLPQIIIETLIILVGILFRAIIKKRGFSVS
jgi:hypothetical protein